MTPNKFLTDHWVSFRQRVLDQASPLHLALPDEVSLSDFMDFLAESEIVQNKFRKLVKEIELKLVLEMTGNLYKVIPAKEKLLLVNSFERTIAQYKALLPEDMDKETKESFVEETIANLPEFHPAQQHIEANLKRFNVIACGRRVGKTTYIVSKIIKSILAGKEVALMLPDFKYLPTLWETFHQLIEPNLIVKSNHTEKVIRLNTGGSIRIHSAEKPDSPRGEKYHEFYIDETSLIPNLEDIWESIIRPTLVDYTGTAVFTGTPKGRNYFYSLFNNQDPDWASFSFPTTSNPHLPSTEIEYINNLPRTDKNKQEYFAEFISEGGEVFASLVIAEPEKATSYRIGIDLAKSQDFTVVSIFNQNNQQVAIHRWNQMNWTDITSKIISIIAKYPKATIVVDKTGVGSPIVDDLTRQGYPVIGFTFTEQSRLTILENLALLIDNKDCTWLDDAIQIKEFEGFQRFSRNGRTILKTSHKHDDCVMAAALALSQQPRRSKPLVFV